MREKITIRHENEGAEDILGRPIKPGWKYYWVEGDPEDPDAFNGYFGPTGVEEMKEKFGRDTKLARGERPTLFGVICFKKGAPKYLAGRKFKVALFKEDVRIGRGEHKVPVYLIEEVKK